MASGFPLAESVRNLVFSYGLNGFPLEEDPQDLVFSYGPMDSL